MLTLNIETLGDDLIIRLTADARSALALNDGDTVVLSRTVSGEVSLAPLDLDHLMRLERNRAVLRRYHNPSARL